MKAFIITLQEHGNKEPIKAAERCVQSIKSTHSKIEPELFSATTPANMKEHMRETFGKVVPWNWPVDDHQNSYDLSTGLFKKTYPARDPMRVTACAVSHARLWKKCVDLNETIVILEQDALFMNTFNPENFSGYEWGAIGLNDPRGATRKSMLYHKMIVEDGRSIQKVPSIDAFGAESLPMGLAGNSAYIIKPHAARDLLNKVDNVGLWPNDALMCKQLFRWLRVCYPFFTKVQGTQSTTTG
ncbi:MAG: glycosyltransferase family 25 protein [Burkholderiaceae bacterium]